MSCVLQAPSNMKSVLQAGWLFTVAVGNIIVLIISEAATLEDQVLISLFFFNLHHQTSKVALRICGRRKTRPADNSCCPQCRPGESHVLVIPLQTSSMF